MVIASARMAQLGNIVRKAAQHINARKSFAASQNMWRDGAWLRRFPAARTLFFLLYKTRLMLFAPCIAYRRKKKAWRTLRGRARQKMAPAAWVRQGLRWRGAPAAGGATPHGGNFGVAWRCQERWRRGGAVGGFCAQEEGRAAFLPHAPWR